MNARAIDLGPRFPRAAAVLHMVAVAAVLRQAANDLDDLAGAAHAYEIGTLVRKARGIVLAACAFADGSTELAEGGAP